MDLGVTMGHYLIFRQTHACLWWSQTCLSPSRSSPKTTSGWVRLLTVALTADWIMMDYDGLWWIMMDYDGLWWIMAIVRGPSIIACNLDGVFSEVHVNTTDLKLNAVDNISRIWPVLDFLDGAPGIAPARHNTAHPRWWLFRAHDAKCLAHCRWLEAQGEKNENDLHVYSHGNGYITHLQMANFHQFSIKTTSITGDFTARQCYIYIYNIHPS